MQEALAYLIRVLKTLQKFLPRQRQARRGIYCQPHLLASDTGTGYFDPLSGLEVKLVRLSPDDVQLARGRG